MKLSRVLCCFILIVLGNLQVFAQSNESCVSKRWIKTVSREIDTRDSLDLRGQLHHAQTGDIQLLEYLKQLSVQQKVRSFNPFSFQKARDNKPVTSREYIINTFCPKDDIGRDLVDSVGYKVYKKKVYHRDSFPTIKDYRLRVMEDWVFDPVSRTTRIQIIAVGLLKEQHDTNFAYRGSYDLFWLSWDDLMTTLVQDHEQSLKNRLNQYIWQDHFRYEHLFCDTSESGIYYAFRASAIVKVKTELCYDTIFQRGHLREEDDLISLAARLYDSVRGNIITAYNCKNGRLVNPIASKDILVKFTPETIVVEDTAIGMTVTKIISHDVNLDLFNNYRVLQSWNFDANTGQTTIKIEGISPAFDNWEYEFAPPTFTQLFWVKLDDIKPLLDDYDIYCPFQNLSRSIWESYFVPQPFMGIDHWKG